MNRLIVCSFCYSVSSTRAHGGKRMLTLFSIFLWKRSFPISSLKVFPHLSSSLPPLLWPPFIPPLSPFLSCPFPLTTNFNLLTPSKNPIIPLWLFPSPVPSNDPILPLNSFPILAPPMIQIIHSIPFPPLSPPMTPILSSNLFSSYPFHDLIIPSPVHSNDPIIPFLPCSFQWPPFSPPPLPLLSFPMTPILPSNPVLSYSFQWLPFSLLTPFSPIPSNDSHSPS